MSVPFTRTTLALAIALPFSALHAEEVTSTAEPETEIVITGSKTRAPLVEETDPKNARQPLPAHDGADYLKTVPGFSVTRKSGTDGDATFRGMAGSRLGIQVEGETILGGCNFRMDAPTAYIYPELYDALTVIKGPQTVSHGPGNSAATVVFERRNEAFTEGDARFYGSVTGASFGRHDEIIDAQAGNKLGYLQVSGSNSESGDYEDGDGNRVHSAYHRYSGSASLGWTPTENSKFELSAGKSDGEAAYADRGMDGTKFDRESANARFEVSNITDLVSKIEGNLYKNDVDHVMDDQELRTPGMMGYAELLRMTTGGKLATTLAFGESSRLTLGVDTQDNDHRSRSAPAMTGIYTAWADDASFSQEGVFAELKHDFSDQTRLIAGYRNDQWEATDKRANIKLTMMMTVANPTANETREESLDSGFFRVEHHLADTATTLYAGLGQTKRFPDYWELIAKQGVAAMDYSAFDDLNPETATQLDAGFLFKGEKSEFNLSAFYNRTSDYILIDYSLPGMGKSSGASRNVDATLWGGEISSARALTDSLKLDASLAYVHGNNDTDGTALSQLSPLEGRLGLNYSQSSWSVGGLVRAVNGQNRVDVGTGNIVGQDLGETAGFTVFSINGSWKPSKESQLSAGIDNLFDKTYAESISRAGGNGMGGAIGGYVQTTRVNEPGRTVWIKASLRF